MCNLIYIIFSWMEHASTASLWHWPIYLRFYKGIVYEWRHAYFDSFTCNASYDFWTFEVITLIGSQMHIETACHKSLCHHKNLDPFPPFLALGVIYGRPNISFQISTTMSMWMLLASLYANSLSSIQNRVHRKLLIQRNNTANSA